MSNSTTSFLRSWGSDPQFDSHQPAIEPASQPTTPAEAWRTAEKISPAWEVDALCWPDVVLRLEQHHAQTVTRVSQHIAACNQAGLKVLALTAADRGTGRTTVAMYLARAASFASLRVALIDADLLYPSLTDQLQLDAPNSWTDCISKNLAIDEVAIQSAQENITIYPLLEPQPASFLAEHQQQIADFITKLASEYDLVILDSSVISNLSDNPSNTLVGIANPSAIQAAIVVTDAELSSHEKTDEACKQLQSLGLSSVGIVENFRP